MIINKHSKKETASHLWFALAIFMLVFNSTPVKKYLRLQLYRHGAPIELSGEHIGMCTHGDCTLLDRHEISTNVSHAIIQSSSDLDIFLFLSAIVASVAFLFFRKRRDGTSYPEIDTFRGEAVPLYLHICRIQV